MFTNVFLWIGSFSLFVFLVVIAGRIEKKCKLKKQQIKEMEDLENLFEALFGYKPAKEKAVKDVQITLVVKPKLNSQALEFKNVCNKETLLLHQIKVDPKSLPYMVIVDHVKRNRDDVEKQKNLFYQHLKVAIDLDFVPKNTSFKQCLNYK